MLLPASKVSARSTPGKGLPTSVAICRAALLDTTATGHS